MKVLCVAEKPSIAKSITHILSGGHFNSRPSSNKYVKNYEFAYRLPGPPPRDCNFTVTSVLGHLTSSDFGSEYREWRAVDPFALFDAPVLHSVSDDMKGVERNLLKEARGAQRLMIWTDCDREGEHIGKEIVDVCRKSNRNIDVCRARFSAIIPAQIHQAACTAGPLDLRLAAAVEARIELDLRIGAALTRRQTMGLQAAVVELGEARNVISYGPCQFPTLGFVVDQYERVQAFVPEPFWYIYVALDADPESPDAGESAVEFTWRRGRLFDYELAVALYEPCAENSEATVMRAETKPTSKWKPLPLTTVELQKSGSRLLKLAPKRVLDIAESLYQKGFLSYPRTETDQFDPAFDHMDLINKQATDGAWGAFAQMLANGGFQAPRNGSKNDKAHPPIHPTAHASNLAGDDKRVYEFVTRRYLACCSRNATGRSTTVEIDIAGEQFTASGLTVLERNYLDVYPYDKWNGHRLPSQILEEGMTFIPSACLLNQGTTTRPDPLTEADLVGLMDKHGIGTDATIAEHISKIIEREYVFKRKEGRGGPEYLVPSTLGMGLVEGYNAIGFEKSLCKPQMRAETEQRMAQICDGAVTKTEVVAATLEEYRDMYIRARQGFNILAEAVNRYMNGVGDGAADGDVGEGGGGGDADDDSGDDSNGGEGGGGGGGGRGRGRGGARGRGRGAGRGRGNAAAAANGRGGGGADRGRGGAARGGRGGSLKRRRKDDDDDLDDGDDGAGPSGGGPPMCKCGEPTVERTVNKEGQNKGRKFYACPKGQGEASCGFQGWADEAGGSKTSASRAKGKGKAAAAPRKRPLAESDSYGNGPRGGKSMRRDPYLDEEDTSAERRCDCDLAAKCNVVKKEGPNQGRAFWSCSKVSQTSRCKFFEWEDEEGGGSGAGGRPGPSRSRPAGGDGGGGGGGCFKCGEEGHWASACPNGDGQPPPRAGPSGGGGRQSNYTCHVCGEQGHFSTNCPNRVDEDEDNDGPRRGASKGGSGDCFLCNKPGHWAADCPTGRGGGGGGKRGGRGRGSSRGRRGSRAR